MVWVTLAALVGLVWNVDEVMTTTEQHDASLDSVKKKLPQAKAAASQRQRTASNPKQNVPPKPVFPQYQVSGQGTFDGAN